MKILWLDQPQYVAGSHRLYAGLTHVLGGDAVVEFPWNGALHDLDMDIRQEPSYRELIAVAEGRTPLPQGVPNFSPDEWLLGGQYHDTPKRNWLPFTVPNEGRRMTLDEVAAAVRAREFDLIVLANSHRTPTIALALLRDAVGRGLLPPIVYLDAGERDELNAHWWHVFRPEIVFKQILTPAELAKCPSVEVPAPLWPMPLSCPYLTLNGLDQFVAQGQSAVLGWILGAWREARWFDAAFWHGDTWEGRPAAIQAMRDVVAETGAFAAPERGFSYWASYYFGLTKTRIALSIRGAGRDAIRYWEVPATGVLLLADGTMGCIHPYPFEDGKNAAFWHSPEELKEKFRYYHRNEIERDRVASAGREHLMRYHCVEARALFFLRIIREQLKIAPSQEQRERMDSWVSQLGWPSAEPDWRGPVSGYEG